MYLALGGGWGSHKTIIQSYAPGISSQHISPACHCIFVYYLPPTRISLTAQLTSVLFRHESPEPNWTITGTRQATKCLLNGWLIQKTLSPRTTSQLCQSERGPSRTSRAAQEASRRLHEAATPILEQTSQAPFTALLSEGNSPQTQNKWLLSLL